MTKNKCLNSQNFCDKVRFAKISPFPKNFKINNNYAYTMTRPLIQLTFRPWTIRSKCWHQFWQISINFLLFKKKFFSFLCIIFIERQAEVYYYCNFNTMQNYVSFFARWHFNWAYAFMARKAIYCYNTFSYHN